MVIILEMNLAAAHVRCRIFVTIIISNGSCLINNFGIFDDNFDNLLCFVLFAVVFTPTAFDALWALGLAFEASLDEIAAIGESLENFDYNKTEVTRIVYNNLLNVSFFGASVCIRARRLFSHGYTYSNAWIVSI